MLWLQTEDRPKYKVYITARTYTEELEQMHKDGVVTLLHMDVLDEDSAKVSAKAYRASAIVTD